LKKYNNEQNLPIPRLQARIIKKGYNFFIEYSLITNNIEGDFESLLSDSDFTSTKSYEKLHHLRPYKTMAIMFADMWNLNLPAYIVSEDGWDEITFKNSIRSIPMGVFQIMKDSNIKKEEFNELRKILLKLNEEKSKLKLDS